MDGGGSARLNGPNNCGISASLLYCLVAAATDNDVSIIDITNPAVPVFVGTVVVVPQIQGAWDTGPSTMWLPTVQTDPATGVS